MIRVTRGEEPASFRIRADELVQQFRREKLINPNLTISKFWGKVRSQLNGDAAILFNRFHGKCAFCESKMADVSNAHIEHYRPKGKSEYENLAFQWDNWLLGCEKCNQNKSINFPVCGESPCLIDPSREDPSIHIGFINQTPQSNSERGTRTIQLIKLDREPLEQERSQWMLYINCLILLLREARRSRDINPDLYNNVRHLLIWCMQDDAPYTAMGRCYIRGILPNLNINEPVNIQEPILHIKEIVIAFSHEFENDL